MVVTVAADKVTKFMMQYGGNGKFVKTIYGWNVSQLVSPGVEGAGDLVEGRRRMGEEEEEELGEEKAKRWAKVRREDGNYVGVVLAFFRTVCAMSSSCVEDILTRNKQT